MPTSNTPQVAINDIGTAEDFLAAVDATIKYFNDGDIVEGTVVKVDHDEVLLDIGYKTEGVIPSRELSIKHDVDPDEVTPLREIEYFTKALIPTWDLPASSFVMLKALSAPSEVQANDSR